MFGLTNFSEDSSLGGHPQITDGEPEMTNEVLPSRCEDFENECRTLRCPYGLRRLQVDGECERCECDNPCAEYSCPDGQKCAVEISNTQSGEFMPVCRLVNKAGDCPQLTSQDNNTVGNGGASCSRECYDDADCRSDNKCCHNGCSFVCVRPQSTYYPVRPQVPSATTPAIIYPGEVRATLEPKTKNELDVQTPMGGIAILRCFATGNPTPNITWSFNNLMVNDSLRT